MPARPFELDYPGALSNGQKAYADATGFLTHDIDGHALHARYVVGRTVEGGADQAFPPAQLNALSEATFGTEPQAATSVQLGKDVGRLYMEAAGQSAGSTVDLYYLNSLSDTDRPRVIAHEIGHGLS